MKSPPRVAVIEIHLYGPRVIKASQPDTLLGRKKGTEYSTENKFTCNVQARIYTGTSIEETKPPEQSPGL